MKSMPKVKLFDILFLNHKLNQCWVARLIQQAGQKTVQVQSKNPHPGVSWDIYIGLHGELLVKLEGILTDKGSDTHPQSGSGIVLKSLRCSQYTWEPRVTGGVYFWFFWHEFKWTTAQFSVKDFPRFSLATRTFF
jgi:hypothetical protein